MQNRLIATVILAMLTACGGAPAPNEMTITRSVDGAFSGSVGSGWSDEELRANAFGALCAKGETLSDLTIARDQDGTAQFSGRCVT